MNNLESQFGQIDIYLFDQILRGRISPGMRVFDSGCGHGRNLIYLLRSGCEVFASDADTAAAAHVQHLPAFRSRTSGSSRSSARLSPSRSQTSCSAAKCNNSATTTNIS